MAMSLRNLFRRRSHKDAGFLMYGSIVAQSRQPAFFRDLEVEDSFEGRYEMLVLHVFLVLMRLRKEPEGGEDFGQAVFDTLFADLDISLREMGVGDLSIAKRIKKLASAFYGHVGAYDEALRAEDDAALVQALDRNVFGSRDGTGDAAIKLARYVRSSLSVLDDAPIAEILRGELVFAPIE